MGEPCAFDSCGHVKDMHYTSSAQGIAKSNMAPWCVPKARLTLAKCAVWSISTHIRMSSGPRFFRVAPDSNPVSAGMYLNDHAGFWHTTRLLILRSTKLLYQAYSMSLRIAENGFGSNSSHRSAATTTTLDFPSPHRLQTGYTAAQLALRYGFPVVTQPADNYVAIIELIGSAGSGWSEDDFKSYCEQVEVSEDSYLPLQFG